MWKKLAELARLLFNFGQELQQNRSDLKELQREVRDLAMVVVRLSNEIQRSRENESHEREKIVLRMENQLLKLKQTLPNIGSEGDRQGN